MARDRSLTRRALGALVRRFPGPRDAPRAWRGELDPELEPLRVVRFGDCSWREIVGWHGRGVAPGYPLVAARRLREHGLGLRFADVFAVGVDSLPQDAERLARHLDLDDDPHVVLLQVGSLHGLRTILTPTPEWMQVRELAGRRMRVLARPGYALVHPALRRFGSVAAPYGGAGPVERFVALARARWPEARMLALAPWPPCRDGWMDPEKVAATWRDVAAACERLGVETLDPSAELATACERSGAHTVYAPNAYDLRGEGQRVVGELLAERLLEIVPRPAASAAHGAGERLGGLEHR